MNPDHHKNPVVNLVIQPNGKKDYSTYFEGIYPMKDKQDNEFGLELLLNLGNFSSLRIIAKRHEENSQEAGEQIVKDLIALKENFLKNSDTLLR